MNRELLAEPIYCEWCGKELIEVAHRLADRFDPYTAARIPYEWTTKDCPDGHQSWRPMEFQAAEMVGGNQVTETRWIEP